MSDTKRTDELVVGDTVRFGNGARTVTYTQAVPSTSSVVIVFDNGVTDSWPQEAGWNLLTDEELAAAQAAARTEGMAQALEHAAKLIREYQLAAPKYTIDISVVLDTIVDLEEWGAAIGAAIDNGGNIPSVDNRNVAEFGGVQLYVHAQSMEKYPPEEDGDGPVNGCDCEDCEDCEDLVAAAGGAEDVRTPDAWLQHPDFTGTNVLDPDGWRRDGLPWSEPLDRQEFERRLNLSTVSAPARAGTKAGSAS